MKNLSSVILSLMLLGFWSCSDYGKDPLSSGDETDCTQELDCNSDCGGSAINDACGVCDGDGSTCNISYSVTIQPIFNANCTSCHNGSHSTGLDLRSYEEATTGSNSGLVIIELDHSSSELWKKINSGSMPPSGSLTSDQINLIETWINEGALNN